MRLPSLPTVQEYELLKAWYEQEKAAGHDVNITMNGECGDEGIKIWIYSYDHAFGMHCSREVLDGVADAEDLHRLFMKKCYETALASANEYNSKAAKLKETAAIGEDSGS